MSLGRPTPEPLDVVPLFPLGIVLYPGVVLPLHIFEERYRVLVQDLMALPEPERRFGVVAIRAGREVGPDGIESLYEHGCIAELRQVEAYDDGRFDIVAVGAGRFQLGAVDETSAPYLRAAVTELAESLGEESTAAALALAVRAAFGSYIEAMAAAQGRSVEVPELPLEPMLLSYLVAATAVIDRADGQALLAANDAASRLQAELVLLRREITMLQTLTLARAPDLARGPVSPN
jgi:Lon protease-like protein